MDLFDKLNTEVGASLVKFLLKVCFGDVGDVVGKPVIDVLKRHYQDRLKDTRAVNEAERQFGSIADEIFEYLQPTLKQEQERGVDVGPVVEQLGRAWDRAKARDMYRWPDDAEIRAAVRHDLDPAKLTAAINKAYRPPRGALDREQLASYERVLAESTRYLVDVADTLDPTGFGKVVDTETLRRLSFLGDDMKKVLETVQSIERNVAQGAVTTQDQHVHVEGSVSDSAIVTNENVEVHVHHGSPSDDSPVANEQQQRFEADYRHIMIRKLDYVELFGSDISSESRRHSLSVAYVSLSLQADEEDGGGSIVAEAILNPERNRVLVRGSAGSGKSTLLRWAAIESSRTTEARWIEGARSFMHKLELPRMEPPPLGLSHEDMDEMVRRGAESSLAYNMAYMKKLDWRFRIPFLIRLRDCKEGKLPPPEDFPRLISDHLGEPPVDWVRAVLKEGRGLVLLDGVDEVPGEFRDTVLLDQIQDIVQAYPKSYFLVSTRPEAVEENWLAGLGFREARINPMSDLDKSQFIDNWHRAVAHERRRRTGSDDGLEALVVKLKEKLPQHPAVNQLASWPLLCAMICALHERTDGELPENQRHLCERLCFMLLDERERKIGLDETYVQAYRRLKYDQKKAIVQELALHMIDRRRESSLEYDDALQEVAKRLANTPDQSADAAADVLRTLVERSGMLRLSRPKSKGTSGRIEFIHNTFKEYLAGMRLASDGADGKLADHADKEDWQRVIVFAASAEISGFATQLVRKVLGDQTEIEANLKAMRRRRKNITDAQRDAAVRVLLAMRCRGVALDLDEELDKWLNSQIEELTPPRSMAVAEAIAGAGDGAVSFLHHKTWLRTEQAAASVRALRLIGTKAAERVLREYFGHEELAVLEELAQAVNPLEIPAVRNMVQVVSPPHREYLKQEGIRRQITDLAPLLSLSEIQTLHFFGTQVTDVSPLSGLRQLQTLILVGTQVADVSPLSGLSRLWTLNLALTPVTDVSPLSRLSQLRILNLTDTQVTDVSPLSGLSQLRALQLKDTQVTDVSPLSCLSRLQTLNLVNTPVSEVGPLSGLSQLKALNLGGTQVTDVGPLSGLSQMEWLSLHSTQVTDISPLSGLSQLKKLRLGKEADVTIPKPLEKCVERV